MANYRPKWTPHFRQLTWASLTVIVSVGGLIASFVAFISASRDKAAQDRDLAIRQTMGSRQAIDLSDQVNALRQDLAKNTANLNALTLIFHSREYFNGVASKGLGMRPEERKEINEYEETQKQLASRMTALEAALSNSPEKALALPLLKQQLNDTQDRFKSDMDEAHAEFGRLYTLVQWAFALIVTTILGLGGFLFLQGKAATTPDKTVDKAA